MHTEALTATIPGYCYIHNSNNAEFTHTLQLQAHIYKGVYLQLVCMYTNSEASAPTVISIDSEWL